MRKNSNTSGTDRVNSDAAREFGHDNVRNIADSPRYQLPEFVPGRFDLVYEMENRRHFYFAPRENEGLAVKTNGLHRLCKDSIRPILDKVPTSDKYPRDPGLQPALAACIAYGLCAMEKEWTEIEDLSKAVDRRNKLSPKVNGHAVAMLDRYLSRIELPTPSIGTATAVLVKVEKEWIGHKLEDISNKTRLTMSTVANIAITIAIVDHEGLINHDHKKQLAKYLDAIREQMQVAAWGAQAILNECDRNPLVIKVETRINDNQSKYRTLSEIIENPRLTRRPRLDGMDFVEPAENDDEPWSE